MANSYNEKECKLMCGTEAVLVGRGKERRCLICAERKEKQERIRTRVNDSSVIVLVGDQVTIREGDNVIHGRAITAALVGQKYDYIIEK